MRSEFCLSVTRLSPKANGLRNCLYAFILLLDQNIYVFGFSDFEILTTLK